MNTQLKTTKTLCDNYYNQQTAGIKELPNSTKAKTPCYKPAKEKQDRRAVSEVITTALLLSITVVGAIMVFVIFQGNIAGNTIGSISLQKAPSSIILLGYDARAGSNMSGISTVNNGPRTTGKLCASSCTASALPPTGSDFIILRFRNQGASNINLFGITVNEFSYSWDKNTAGITLNPSGTSGSSPADGKYSLISTDNTKLTQFINSTIPAESDIRVVVKLSTSTNPLNPDIPLNSVIRITINIGDIKANTAFIAPAGQAS